MSRELTNPQTEQDITLPPDTRVNEIIRNRVIFRETSGKFEIDRDLTPPEREHLRARKQAIARHLRPLGTASEEKRRLALALASLFLGYPSLRTDHAATERITAYVDALSSFPIYAALKAVEAVKTGAVDDLNSDFPPTSVRLAEIAAKYVGDVRRERFEVESTLEAHVGEVDVPPERRKELAQEMLKHSQKIREEANKDHIDRNLEFEKQSTAKSNSFIEREWQQCGMQPRYSDPLTKTMPLSIEMARKYDMELDVKLNEIGYKSRWA